MTKIRTVGESQGPASENLVQVLVELEPVGQDTKDEEEHGKSPEEDGTQDGAGVPDLASHGGDEIRVVWQAESKMLIRWG
jgi:hypothetical protein